MATAIMIKWARARAAAGRRLTRRSPSAAPMPEIVNLAPGFNDLYVHGHNRGDLVEVPGRPGVTGVRVVGLGGDNDTHIAPGGRNEPGRFQLGLRAGGTYTAGVTVFLPAPLTGDLNVAALRIIPGCLVGETLKWVVAQSRAARNEYGHHRLSVTFTVPANATAAWIRLHSGMAAGHGETYWHSFTLTETDHPVDHFDGSTPDDDFYAYEWTGAPQASPSRRVVRVKAGSAVADEAVRLARTGAVAEARALVGLLDGDRLAAARVTAAAGDLTAARKALRRLDDPDGAVAAELGDIALRQRSWATAERWLSEAAGKRPTDAMTHYRLAYAYDKLQRRNDSKRAAAAGLAHDPDLPFDGPAVLDLDVKSFGARREVGVFLAEHLDQIRVQAEQRLAAPPVTSFDQPIFIYWGQGFDAAPPLVRACLAALKAGNPGERVHELTDETIGAYVDVPADIVAKLGDNKTHFSDLVRLVLLEKFGGVWVDGTCFVSEPLRPHIDEVLAKGSLFAFHYHGPYISNWLLAARAGSYAMHLWRAASFLWWEQRGELIDYFLHHHVFEMLYHLDPRFRAEWDEGVRLSTRPPHALQQVMLKPYDPEKFRALTAGSFAHKLSYKYPADELTSESFLAHVIRGDLP